MPVHDLIGSPVPGLAAALAAAPAEAPIGGDGLVALPWFPFDVRSVPAVRRVAARIARRADAACSYLRQVLGVAPAVRLVVLDHAHWLAHADTPEFGVVHVNGRGELVVGAEPAVAWTGISRWLAGQLDARTLAGLLRVHGLDPRTGGPALGEVAEALIAHEIAHVLCDEQGVRFPRRWLGEAFANYVMVAVLGETDPAGLRRLGSLADAAATLAHLTPPLARFEAEFGQMDVIPSVLAQLALTRGVYGAYAAAQSAPLALLYRSYAPRGGLTAVGNPDADFELGRMLALHVHSTLAEIPELFPAAPLRAAA